MMDGNKKCAVILLAEDDPGDQKLTPKAFNDGKIDNKLYIVNITKPVNFASFVDAVQTLGKYWFKLVVLPPTHN